MYGKIADASEGQVVVYDVVSNSSSDLTNMRTAYQEVVSTKDGQLIRASVISDYKKVSGITNSGVKGLLKHSILRSMS